MVVVPVSLLFPSLLAAPLPSEARSNWLGQMLKLASFGQTKYNHSYPCQEIWQSASLRVGLLEEEVRNQKA